MTKAALDELVEQMRLEKTPEEIPAALERVVDDKHQKELEDLLLKLYEQKCVELKEEVLAMMEEKVQKMQEMRKGAADRKKGIDAIIARTHEPTELEKLEQRKKEIDSKLEKDLADIENEYIKKEGMINHEVQKRNQQREVDYIQELQQKQLEEKQEIFMTYLPNSLMTNLITQMKEEDIKAMQALREQLEKQNAEQLAKLEADQRELEANLARQKAELDRLGDQERLLIEKEARRGKIDAAKERDAANRIGTQDYVAKMIDEHKKGLDAIENLFNEEKLRQLEEVKIKQEARQAQVQEARRIREEEKKKKEEEAKREKQKEIDRIKELRAAKAKLEKTLAEGQRLIYKQCYSKPLYSFNKKLNELQLKNEDFAWLNEKKQTDEFAKDIVSSLLFKITELERTVTTDVRNDVFIRPPVAGGDTASDNRSATGGFERMSSVASFRPKVARDVIKKLKLGGKGGKKKF